MSQEQRQLLSVEQVANRLNLSPRTIRNRICRKAKNPFPIKAKRLGRRVLFDSVDVRKFIESLPYSQN